MASCIRNYRDFLQGEPRGRAVLSYLPGKMAAMDAGHEYRMAGNTIKANYIPRALNELGFLVDYVDWKDTTFRPEGQYDLFIGHGGYNYERIAEELNGGAVLAYYACGFYWQTFNALEAARFDALFERRGVRLPPDRKILASEEYAVRNAQGLIVRGSGAVDESYHEAGIHNTYCSPGVCMQSEWGRLDEKDYAEGRRHFLFYSGGGNVHKGLDLLLEAFAQAPDLHLHICQSITPGFRTAYKRELRLPNIHSYEYIRLREETYARLVMQCDWVISATCADACPNAVLESMQHGLIPVVTHNASIDLHDFGWQIPDNVPGILNTIQLLAGTDPAECRERAGKAVEDIGTNHSPAAFLANFKERVEKVLQ